LIHKIYSNDFDFGFDYSGIVHASFLSTLVDHGFSISDDEKQFLNESYEGATFNLFNYNKISNPNFFNEDCENIPKSQTPDILLKKRELASKGIIEIDMICKTKEYNDFISKISDFSSNPFLPRRIQEIFKKVLTDSEENINVHVKETLCEVMQVYYRKFNELNRGFAIEPHEIYNLFNSRRIEHAQDFNLVKEEVRKYLKIDRMP